MTGNDDGGPRWLAALGASLLAHGILIASAIIWVAMYSHFIAPGLPMPAYHAYAQASGPWISLIVGLPLFIWLARWIGLRLPARAMASALALAGLYIATDTAVLLMAADSPVPWAMVALSYATKLGAAVIGGRLAAKTSSATR